MGSENGIPISMASPTAAIRENRDGNPSGSGNPAVRYGMSASRCASPGARNAFSSLAAPVEPESINLASQDLQILVTTTGQPDENPGTLMPRRPSTRAGQRVGTLQCGKNTFL